MKEKTLRDIMASEAAEKPVEEPSGGKEEKKEKEAKKEVETPTFEVNEKGQEFIMIEVIFHSCLIIS